MAAPRCCGLRGRLSMETKYLDEMRRLLMEARPELSTTHQLEFKSLFGAVAGYVDGHIFISCGKFGVALKLPREILDDLFRGEGCQASQVLSQGARQEGIRRAPEADTGGLRPF